jgi:hypothetical protein
MDRKFILTAIAVASIVMLDASRACADEASYEIHFEDHHFVPQSLTVAAGQPLTIKVVNSSNETIEFESFKLNREKAMAPGETIFVKLPALSAGDYDFYDDFHQDVPEGSIVAK